MDAKIENIFDEAENRYLNPEELGVLSQYVESLPDRLDAYRTLRDQELNVMQKVADQLQVEMPQETIEDLERCIKNALLMLRYCAMGMLLNDPGFVQSRLVGWLSQTTKIYNTKKIDAVLYRLLQQELSQTLAPQQMAFLKPILTLAQDALVGQEPLTVSALGW
jgi:Phycobilisome protein